MVNSRVWHLLLVFGIFVVSGLGCNPQDNETCYRYCDKTADCLGSVESFREGCRQDCEASLESDIPVDPACLELEECDAYLACVSKGIGGDQDDDLDEPDGDIEWDL